MQALPPNQAGPGPLEFIMRLIMGLVTLVIIAAMVAFGAVIIGALLFALGVAAIWVRWKAGRENMDWRTWLTRRMTRGVQAGWKEARRPEPAERDETGVKPDFYTTITTIEGEYAVVDEASKRAAAAENASKTANETQNS